MEWLNWDQCITYIFIMCCTLLRIFKNISLLVVLASCLLRYWELGIRVATKIECRWIIHLTLILLLFFTHVYFQELSNMASSQVLALGISCLYFLSTGIKNRLPHPLRVYVGSRNHCSRLQAWMARTLTTEPSPHPLCGVLDGFWVIKVCSAYFIVAIIGLIKLQFIALSALHVSPCPFSCDLVHSVFNSTVHFRREKLTEFRHFAPYFTSF